MGVRSRFGPGRSRAQRMSSRKLWVRHAADVAGTLTLDAGAVEAVLAGGVVGYDRVEPAAMIGHPTAEPAPDARRPAVHAGDLVAVQQPLRRQRSVF